MRAPKPGAKVPVAYLHTAAEPFSD